MLGDSLSLTEREWLHVAGVNATRRSSCVPISLVHTRHVRTYAYLARVDRCLEAVTRHAALLVVDVAKLTAFGAHGLWSRALQLSRVCVGGGKRTAT